MLPWLAAAKRKGYFLLLIFLFRARIRPETKDLINNYIIYREREKEKERKKFPKKVFNFQMHSLPNCLFFLFIHFRSTLISLSVISISKINCFFSLLYSNYRTRVWPRFCRRWWFGRYRNWQHRVHMENVVQDVPANWYPVSNFISQRKRKRK